MGTYTNYADTPNTIVKEGEEITITFTRNKDGTGTVNWNIPAPVNGCDTASQAYNGILITVDTKAANYISTSPTNGVRYMGDPTADPDMHAGSKLDTALVEAAYYDDKTTTSLTITDVDPSKFYYVSGYAVDNVGTYHTQGVHAYSLPSGEAEKPPVQYNAYQDISLLPHDGSKTVGLGTLTGLDKTKTYDFHIKIDNVDYHLPIRGSEAQSYNDMINALNKQFKLITGVSGWGSCGELPPANAQPPYVGPLPPNANQWYVDIPNQKVYFFDGTHNLPQNAVFFDQDPSMHPQGTYWFNPNDPDTIKMYETGGWATQPFIQLDHDPTKPACGELWFTGTNAYEWDGDHWCQLCLYVQTRNPSLAPILDCNTYWYDAVNGTLHKWDAVDTLWMDALAIISNKDPNTLGVGDFWLNETDGKMYRFSAGTWNLMTNVRYDAPDSSGNIDYPAPNTYWLNPDTQVFYKRDAQNTTWTPVEYTMYPTDPRQRASCDLWWNQSPSIDTLFAWDIVNGVWKPVQNFLQQANDPALPPNLPACAVWYNPSDGTLKYIMDGTCANRDFIYFLFDPTNPPIGTVWYDTLNKKYYVWDGADWNQIYPIISTFDPFVMYNGYLWFDTSSAQQLKQWNGTGWTVLPYTTKNPMVPQGTLWYNSANDELYQWNGSAWVVATPVITVSLKHQVDIHDPNVNGRAYLFFLFNTAGCCHRIEIWPDTGSLLASVQQGVIYNEPMEGGNGASSGPMYNQLGVGTDGSPDERRELAAKIRAMLGSMGVTVELTKEQINYAIDNALMKLRQYSSYSTNRYFFFLDLKPNQQTYVLANKCIGFNKITEIRDIYRMQAGWIRTGLAGNELFGVAALQQLYTVGTFDMLSFALMSQYMKELEQLFASRIMHQWDEQTRELRLYQRIVLTERVLVDATVERSEQYLITSRHTGIWLFNFAMAECKLILGQLRGKFLNLPGPNGSTSMNAQDLISQAQTEKQALEEELKDPAMGNYENVGLSAHFTIG